MSTVIVFAKAPVPGQVKTRLGLEPRIAVLLHELFVAATLRTCLQLAVHVELHTDQPTEEWSAIDVPHVLQVPGDLGQRMLAALESRPGPVMIVGSDAPTLPLDHLRGLLASQADVALGPAEDGGYYAIAARRTHPDMFEGVEWSSGRELKQTVAACQACGLSVELGEPWFDVDTAADLLRLPSEFLDPVTREQHLGRK